MGGFVMYVAVMFFIPAIYMLAKREEKGYYLAVGLSIMTLAINLSVWYDRRAQPSGMDWMKGAALSAVLLGILLTPWIKNGVLETTE